MRSAGESSRTAGLADGWWLDAKLGLRMLFKYRGLALVGGFGIAVAVAIATGGFSVIFGAFLVSSIPLDEGDRIVSLEMWDAASSKPERRLGADFEAWRRDLRSVEGLSAFRTFYPNVTGTGIAAGSLRVTAMSASGFRLARVKPLLGRYLMEEDEREGAPRAAVIGERIWRNRFGRDPGILGRKIEVGATPYAIAGVMPEDFAFPVQDQLWVPLRESTMPTEALTGQELMVFGRLAAGISLQEAQAELTTAGQRRAAADPDRYGPLKPRVMPYTYPFAGLHESSDVSGILVMQGVTTTLLVLICLNVAILLYSRTATRQGEFAVRTALGASRGRIVAQLFVEALVLSVVATTAGVGMAALALKLIENALVSVSGELPFWVSLRLSSGAVAWAALLSLLAAVVVGILPALTATKREVSADLKGMGTGGSGNRLGRTWTVLIVAQVGFAVALLPGAIFGAWRTLESGLAQPGFAAREYLTAELTLGAAGADFNAKQGELLRRLRGEAGVVSVTYAMENPGAEATTQIDAEGPGRGVSSGIEVRLNRVDTGYFQTFEVPILAGRGFGVADLTGESRSVVVNRSFAEKVFAGNALGRRVRYTVKGDSPGKLGSGPWFEVVGIAGDFPTGGSTGMGDSPLKLYHPVGPGQLQSVKMAVRLRGVEAKGFAGRLREIVAAVDAELEVRNVLGLEEGLRQEQWIRRGESIVLGLLTVSVLMLSAAGIYALMSITVSQRRKEIGIRTALGADIRHIVGSIFARACGQLAAGAALGMGAAAAAEQGLGLLQGRAGTVLPAVALLMLTVGIAAAIGPVRQSLKIEPTEALREQ